MTNQHGLNPPLIILWTVTVKKYSAIGSIPASFISLKGLCTFCCICASCCLQYKNTFCALIVYFVLSKVHAEYLYQVFTVSCMVQLITLNIKKNLEPQPVSNLFLKAVLIRPFKYSCALLKQCDVCV